MNQSMLEALSQKIESMRAKTRGYLEEFGVDEEKMVGIVLNIIFMDIDRVINSVLPMIKIGNAEQDGLAELLQLLENYELDGLRSTVNEMVRSAILEYEKGMLVDYEVQLGAEYNSFYRRFLNITLDQVLENAEPQERRHNLFLSMQYSKISYKLGRIYKDMYKLICLIIDPVQNVNLDEACQLEAEKPTLVLVDALQYLNEQTIPLFKSFLKSDNYKSCFFNIAIANDPDAPQEQRWQALRTLQQTFKSAKHLVLHVLEHYLMSTPSIDFTTRAKIEDLKGSCQALYKEEHVGRN